MKIAILSDIHSNKPALDCVYQDAINQQVKEYWCLGDVVGYCPWPYQCWEKLNRIIKPKFWLPGNHELAMYHSSSTYCSGDAKTVIDLHRKVFENYPVIFEQIATQEKNYVLEPYKGVFLAHGVYDEVDLYKSVTTYMDSILDRQVWVDDAISQLENRNKHPKLFVVGHTHVPVMWQRKHTNVYLWQKIEFQQNEIFSLKMISDEIVLINPGSVGQPRDGHLEASYCILCWNENENAIESVEFRRVPYPIQSVLTAIKDGDYPPGLLKHYTKSQTRKEGPE